VPLVAVGALLAAGLFARTSIPQPTPPVAASDSGLRSIACPVGGSCLAVGETGSKYTVNVPMAARSAKGTWSVQALSGRSAAGDSELAAVSCSSTTSCVAVGRQEIPAAYLGARAAGDRPITELWHGSTWTPVSRAVPKGAADGELSGVDCVPAMCMAVGSYSLRLGDDRPLAERWDGSRWSLRLPPRVRTGDEGSDSDLSDVACTSPTSCVAVGWFSYEMAVVAGIGPLIQRWDGKSWTTERSANTASPDTELTGVSCPTVDRCIAVGLQRRHGGVYRPFAETWDGRSWETTPVADPSRSPDSELLDIDCPGRDWCVAVGFRIMRSRFHPLVETWDGRRWTIDALDPPADATSSTLSSVDCPSSTTCHAIGTYARTTPLLHSFSVSLSGDRPTVVLVPDA